MKTGIKEIDDELESILELEREEYSYETVEDFLKDVLYDNYNEDLIIPIVDEIKYADRDKSYTDHEAVIYLPRIDFYFKMEYKRWTDGIENMRFLKRVFAVPKKITAYE